ncbi:hypothetical protein DER44DRAFT_317847 [Fusarium oxysporum]|nr:hypothetical protein DER44DRAFT_317847 [Fusarium oxysporum]
MDSATASLATGRPNLTAADVKATSIREILANIRRNVKLNKKRRRRARVAAWKKRRVPADELVASG